MTGKEIIKDAIVQLAEIENLEMAKCLHEYEYHKRMRLGYLNHLKEMEKNER